MQSVQVTSVPGDFDSVSDGAFHSGRGGLECFRHLGVENLGDGIDHIHIVDCNDDGFSQILVALDVGRDADLVDDAGDQTFDTVGQYVYGVNALVFIKLPLL